MFEKIMRWFNMGLWTRSMVEQSAKLGVISPEECAAILGEEDE